MPFVCTNEHPVLQCALQLGQTGRRCGACMPRRAVSARAAGVFLKNFAQIICARKNRTNWPLPQTVISLRQKQFGCIQPCLDQILSGPMPICAEKRAPGGFCSLPAEGQLFHAVKPGIVLPDGQHCLRHQLAEGPGTAAAWSARTTLHRARKAQPAAIRSLRLTAAAKALISCTASGHRALQSASKGSVSLSAAWRAASPAKANDKQMTIGAG